MKKRNHLIGIIFISFVIFVLSGCSSTNSSSIPEYKGMTISNRNLTPDILNKKSVSKVLQESNSNVEYQPPEYDNHEEDDEVLTEQIEDLVNIEVVTDDEVKYYVRPNETFTIEIHLSNPYQYEIQSFTLNGKKYSNYMFKDGSTMELLLLETTAPSTPGYFEYSIDAIKYIDGTEIKDVKMSGDKTIKTGIEHSNSPSAQILNQNISTTFIDLILNINDLDSLIDKNSLKIYLSNGEEIIDEKPLKVGENNITFKNLKAHTLYEYGISATFDLVDGRDKHNEWLLQNSFKTQGIYSLENIEQTKTSITFKVNKNGDDGQIDSISLYDKNNGKLIASGNSSTNSFDGLLSNHTYKLYVDFSYFIDGVKIADWVGEDITTLPMVEPKIEILKLNSDKTSIAYKINIDDVDNISSVDKIELLKDDISIDSSSELEGIFSDLLSNNSYTLKVYYSYDLNDGNGKKTSYVEEKINTVAKEEPFVAVEEEKITDNFIGAKLNFNDNDSVGFIESVELYKGNELISKNSSREINFTNLDYYTDYKVVVNYSFDLNDGKGVVKKTFEKIYKTSPYIEFTDCQIINTSAIGEGETIYMEVEMINPLGAIPKTVIINGQEYSCSASTSYNSIYVEIVNDGQFEGGETTLKIEEVVMTLDEVDYSIVPLSNNSDVIFINGKLLIESAKIVNENNEEIEYAFASENVYLLLNLNNKSNYQIDKIEVGHDQYQGRAMVDNNSITKINQNTYKCRLNFSSGDFYRLWISSITYSNQYITKTLNTNVKINYFFKLNFDEIIEIYNVEDLLNAEYSSEERYYKLMNDIDLSGIEWSALPVFSGVFDGNGYAIKNMTNVSTIYDKDVMIGLFQDIANMGGALFKNLNIENMKILVDHKTTTGKEYFISVGAFIAGNNSVSGNCCYFENCNVTGDISVTSNVKGIDNGGVFLGGFVGEDKSCEEVSIRNCNCNVSINLNCPNAKKERGPYIRFGALMGYVSPDWCKCIEIYNSSISAIINSEYSLNESNKLCLIFGFLRNQVEEWGDDKIINISNTDIDLNDINGIKYQKTENFVGSFLEYYES